MHTPTKEPEELSRYLAIIKDAAWEVRNILNSGFLENCYRDALLVELRLRGLKCDKEWPIKVYYKGIEVGNYYADLLVEDSIIIELKMVKALSVAHSMQLVNYLTGTGIELGVLINYGFDYQIMVKTRTYKDPRFKRVLASFPYYDI